MLTMKWICNRLAKNKYYYSKHADQERQKENLTIAEIEEALLKGRILENYKNSGRGVSCLVVGFTDLGKPVHVVCGKRGDWSVLITVYIPAPPKFINPFERGKK